MRSLITAVIDRFIIIIVITIIISFFNRHNHFDSNLCAELIMALHDDSAQQSFHRAFLAHHFHRLACARLWASRMATQRRERFLIVVLDEWFRVVRVEDFLKRCRLRALQLLDESWRSRRSSLALGIEWP